jgi:hypothetical protein
MMEIASAEWQSNVVDQFVEASLVPAILALEELNFDDEWMQPHMLFRCVITNVASRPQYPHVAQFQPHVTLFHISAALMQDDARREQLIVLAYQLLQRQRER